jgi:hypothetical protein
VGIGALVRRRPQQPAEAEDQQRQRRADRGAQEPGGLAFQLELPPELVGVVDVLEGEEPEPHRGGQRPDERRVQAGEKCVSSTAARRFERGSRPPQHDEDNEEQPGFLVVEAFQQRRNHAGHDGGRVR